MRSSLPSLASLTWIPVTAALGITTYNCIYTYRLIYLMTWYMAQLDGADWTGTPSTQRHTARTAGVAASCIGGAATFFSFKYALDKILLAPKPSTGRLFDRLAAARETPPLTFSRLSLIGPRATSHTLRVFARAHGLQCASIFLSAMWAVVLAPVIHARTEVALCMRGEAKVGAERDRALQELRRIMGLQRTSSAASESKDETEREQQ